MKAFFSDVIFFALVNGLSKAIPLIMLIFLTHYFSPEVMGKIESLTAFYLIMSVFGMFQLDTAFQRFFHDFKPIIYFNVIYMVFSLSIFVSIVSFFILNVGFVERLIGYPIFQEKLYISLMPIFLNLFLLSTICFRYTYKSKVPITIMSVAQLSVFSLLIVCFVKNESLNVTKYLSSLLASYLICSFISLLVFFYKYNKKVNLDCVKSVFYFSLPQFPARIISISSQQGNRFIIVYVLGVSALGVFSISNKLSLFYGVLLGAFNLVWYPMIYDKKFDFNSEYKRFFKIIVLSLSIISPILCFLSWFVYNFYVDDKFSDGLELSWLLLYSSSAFIIKEVIDSSFKLNCLTSKISLTYFWYFIVLILTMILFSYFFGLIGVGYSMYFSSVFMLIYSCYLVKNCFDVKYNVCFIYGYFISGLIVMFFLARYC